jgi:hypothetical protein
MAIIYPNDLPSEHPAFAPPPGSVLDLDIASRLGLIGLWTVQENAGKTLYDIIGYNNMTTNGSPTWGTSPDNILGSYLQMSGASQWAQTTTVTTNPLNVNLEVQNISAEGWAYVDTLPTNGMVFSKSSGDWRIYLTNTGVWGLSVGTRYSGTTTGTPTATTGKWYHVGFRSSNNLVDFFINGIRYPQTGVVAGAIAYTVGSPFFIGARAGPGLFWIGRVTRVAAYNTFLAENEFMKLYYDPWYFFKPLWSGRYWGQTVTTTTLKMPPHLFFPAISAV